MSNDDLNWLASQRPSRLATDREAHDRALMALLRHASSRPGRERSHGRIRVGGLLRTPVFGVSAAIGTAAIAAAVMLSSGSTGSGRLDRTSASPLQAAVTHHHGHSPSALVRLADDVSTAATAPGDATLMARTTTLSTQGSQAPQSVTVYDLYADSGKYYFSRDERGLAGQVSGGITQGGQLFAREIAAAKEAAAGDVQQGTLDMAAAPNPSATAKMTQPVNWQATKAKLEAMAKSGDKQAEAQLQAGPGAQGTPLDNWAWEDSQDAICAGTADPQVLAGVLKIIATLPGVTTTQATVDGQPALVLSSGPQETGVGYTEQLTVNAETGQPIRFTGGTTGATPGATVTYKVARVTLSDVAAGKLPTL